jgi:hypothetical protein
MDSDSDAIAFADAPPASECSGVVAEIDASVVQALANVDHWTILDNNTIELRGPATIRLIRK